ncbi:hypothetical protein OQA88_694 [Cercophora sp. LCS_1]
MEKMTSSIPLTEIPATIEAPRDLQDRPSQRYDLISKARVVWPSIVGWTALLIFTGLFSAFIGWVLLGNNPFIGNTTFDGSTTNLLLSIFSQLYAMLLGFVISRLLNDWRWFVVANESLDGISAQTFAQLGPGTGFFTTLYITIAGRLKSPVGLIKLAIPFLAIAFGSVLKFQSSFTENVYGPTIEVYAGATLLDTSVFSMVTTEGLTPFVEQWTGTLLHYPRFVTQWPLETCIGGCKSFFLPGSIDQVRPRSSRNFLAMNQQGLMDAKALRVHDAAGIGLKFVSIPGEADAFDHHADCETYGESDTRGIYICGKQMGDAVAAGNMRPPVATMWIAAQCIADQSWKKAAFSIDDTTVMTAYHQRATTTYDRAALTIKSVKGISPPTSIPLVISDFRDLWSRVLTYHDGNSSSNNPDAVAVRELLDRLERTFRFDPSSGAVSHVERLQNFLGVNIQFGTTAVQWANISLDELDIGLHFGGLFSLDGMAATATAGRLVEQFVVQPWAAWLFIAGGFLVTVASGLVLLWILLQEGDVPKRSGVPELDIIPEAGLLTGASTASGHTMQLEVLEGKSLGETLISMEPREQTSLRQLMTVLTGKRIVSRNVAWESR